MHARKGDWGWEKDADGFWKLPERVQEYVDWLTNPEKPDDEPTQVAFAKKRNMWPQQLQQWKRDKRVRDNIERRFEQLNISPDRVQQVVDAMFARAKAGDTNAAKLYLQFIERLAPPKVIVEDKRVKDMSDAELAQALDEARGSIALD